MTAEKKKGKYVYYRCTGFRGACGNTYIREERLADLLGDTIAPIQITSEIAAGIAETLRTGDAEVEQRRSEAIRQLEQRRRTVMSKLDRGYDDFVAGHISEDLWKRKSAEWEADLQALEAELTRVEQPRQPIMTTAERILELAQKAEFLYKSQDRAEQRRLLEIVLSNCTFDRGSLTPTYNSPFDLLVRPVAIPRARRQLMTRPAASDPVCAPPVWKRDSPGVSSPSSPRLADGHRAPEHPLPTPITWRLRTPSRTHMASHPDLARAGSLEYRFNPYSAAPDQGFSPKRLLLTGAASPRSGCDLIILRRANEQKPLCLYDLRGAIAPGSTGFRQATPVPQGPRPFSLLVAQLAHESD